jgi:hypothetical protein
MPFKTIEAAKAANFPTAKEKIDLTLEQINKLAEIYDAIKAGGNADDPMAFAWNAWKNVFKKVGDTWVLAKNEQQNTITNATPAKKHDVILQTLDIDNNGAFRAKEAYEKTLSAWNNLPLIFAKNHPDMIAFVTNPSKALNDINGKIVGCVKNPYISITGHPRLMSALTVTDKNVDTLIEEGKASISTGLFRDINEYNVYTSVTPNHVLIFEEDTEVFPADRGSMVLNQNNNDPTNLGKSLADVRSFFTRLLKLDNLQQEEGYNRHKKKEVSQKGKMDKIEELAEELQTMKLELVTAKAELNQTKATSEDITAQLKAKDAELNQLKTTHTTELKEATDKITAFEQETAARAQAAIDVQWNTLKKDSIPPGFTHKPEDEKKLKELFVKEPHAFMTKLVEYNTAGGTEQEGEEYNQKDADTYAKTNAEFEGQLGVKD